MFSFLLSRKDSITVFGLDFDLSEARMNGELSVFIREGEP